MPRNGSGTYSLPAGQPVVTGTVIDSSVHNTFASDVATALTNSIAKNGETTPTANLPMGTYRHTGVGDASARTHYASAGQVCDSSLTTLGSVAGTNTITASVTPAITAYATGQEFLFTPANNSTGAVTINLNSLGAKDIVKGSSATALVSGDLVTTTVAKIIYDGTRFVLQNPATVDTRYALLASSNVFTGASQTVQSTEPNVFFDESDASANERRWRMVCTGGTYHFQTQNDAASAQTTFMQVDRTGTTVDSIALTATAITVNGVAVSDFARLSQSNTFTATQVISGATASLVLYETDAAANNGKVQLSSTAEGFGMAVMNDALAAGTEFFRVERTANTVDSIALAATTITLNGVAVSDFARLSQNNTFGPVQTFTGEDAGLYLTETGVSADNGKWLLNANAESFTMYAVNDGSTVFTSFFNVDRTGTTVDSIALSATAITLNGVAVFSGTSAPIRLNAADATGDCYIQAYSNDGSTARWYVGNGSGASNELQLVNETSGAAINIITTGGGSVNINGSGAVTAANLLSTLLTVDGAGSGIDADLLDGQSSAFYQSASNLNAGTLPDARFPATLPAASGANLTALNASNISSGTLSSARLHTTVDSGTYTPTLTNSVNISASTSYVCQWLRIGNVVTVSGNVDVTCTSGAGVATSLELTLPVASDFASANQAGSVGRHNSSPCGGGANPSSNRVYIDWFSSTGSSTPLFFTFTYLIV
jgi:hypothetical protein